MPVSVRKLIWCGENCTIRSNRYKEYLYPADYCLRIGNYRGSVFTWESGELDKVCYWRIKMNKGVESFTIQNIESKGYLHYNHDIKNRKKLGPITYVTFGNTLSNYPYNLPRYLKAYWHAGWRSPVIFRSISQLIDEH